MAENDDRKDAPKLSTYERAALLLVLEECTNDLIIYEETLKRPSKRNTDSFVNSILLAVGTSDALIKEVLTDEVRKVIDDMEEEAIFDKLRQDSFRVRTIIEKLKDEIREEGRFDVLTKEIERIETRNKEEDALFEACKRMKETILELKKSIVDEKATFEMQKERLQRKLFEARNEEERLKLITKIECKFTSAWEKAQCDQNSIKCKKELEKLEDTLKDYREREKIENRVSTELISFLTQDLASMEVEIGKWQERYDREKKMYEMKIYEVSNDIEARRKNLDQLSEEYRFKQDFIDTYLAELEVLRKQKEHEAHVQRCAIRIQAWWRGVMVRQKLGPYRPEEKKKKRLAKTKK